MSDSGMTSVEIVTGGRGLQPPSGTILVHALALVYFVTWAVLYGILLHWRTSMNAWVLAFVAAGTGFVVAAAVLGVASSFASSNISSNLESAGLHYTSGLVLVGLVMESSLIFFLAIVVPAALQLGFLAFNETCCTWSGTESTPFVATYLISLFYYHLGIAQSIRLLNADLKPVWQVTGAASRKIK